MVSEERLKIAIQAIRDLQERIKVEMETRDLLEAITPPKREEKGGDF
jgi:hypothetical protein